MAINFNRSEFYGSLVEIVGFKCGIALARPELIDLLRKVGAENYADYREDQRVRIHSETYEEIVYELLKAFGRV